MSVALADNELSQAYPAAEEVISMKTEQVYHCPTEGCDYTDSCRSCAASHCWDLFWHEEGA